MGESFRYRKAGESFRRQGRIDELSKPYANPNLGSERKRLINSASLPVQHDF